MKKISKTAMLILLFASFQFISCSKKDKTYRVSSITVLKGYVQHKDGSPNVGQELKVIMEIKRGYIGKGTIFEVSGTGTTDENGQFQFQAKIFNADGDYTLKPWSYGIVLSGDTMDLGTFVWQ